MATVAMVGSRETPPETLAQVKTLSKWLYANRYEANSGHADGFDIMAEHELLERCTVYYPWDGFNKKFEPWGKKVVVGDDRPDLDELVFRFHPMFIDYPPRGTKTRPEGAPVYYPMKRGVFALHRRNGCQVLGLNLDQPVSAVVCWAPGEDGGGTGQAIRIAKAYGIPVLNMRLPEWATCKQVAAELERIHGRVLNTTSFGPRDPV